VRNRRIANDAKSSARSEARPKIHLEKLAKTGEKGRREPQPSCSVPLNRATPKTKPGAAATGWEANECRETGGRESEPPLLGLAFFEAFRPFFRWDEESKKERDGKSKKEGKKDFSFSSHLHPSSEVKVLYFDKNELDKN
jgi:hypothetical protein